MLDLGSDDDSIKLWDAKTGAKIRTLEGYPDSVGSVTFSADRQMLASDFQITVGFDWVALAGEQISRLPANYRKHAHSIMQS
jgi:WD40 repeat protein